MCSTTAVCLVRYNRCKKGPAPFFDHTLRRRVERLLADVAEQQRSLAVRAAKPDCCSDPGFVGRGLARAMRTLSHSQ